MAYEVEVTSRAAKEIMRLPRAEQSRVGEKIDGLVEEPRPVGVEKLSGYSDAYRVRSGNYRIVYTIDDTVRIVTVTRVAHRSEVYRRRK